jgi:Tfp pilus assembly protein PilZ
MPGTEMVPTVKEAPTVEKEPGLLSSEPQPGSNPANPILLSLNIESVTALQRAFVPIIEGGGLFIPDHQTGIHPASVVMDSRVFLLLRIRNPDFQDALTGRVVWLKPRGSSGGKNVGSGFALQFPEAGDRLRQLLENQSLSGREESGALAIFE